MKKLGIFDLEIGKEYFLFSKQFNVSNRVKFLGFDREVNPSFFKATGDIVRGIGYFEYSHRLNNDRMAIHEFELEMGFEELTETHQKGTLVS